MYIIPALTKMSKYYLLGSGPEEEQIGIVPDYSTLHTGYWAHGPLNQQGVSYECNHAI